MKRALMSLEGKNERLARALSTARTELQAMQDQVAQVSEPPAQVGVFLEAFPDVREAEVAVGGRVMRLGVAPEVDLLGVSIGQEVRITEQMVVSDVLGYRRTGQMASVVEMVGVDRVLVNTDASTLRMVLLAGRLRSGTVKPGDSLIVDTRAHIAIEKVTRKDVEQLLQPEIPNVTYSDIGGLNEQIVKVRDAVELPFTHPQLYRDYGLRAPKGILLYGPPGCGKTLIAKAVASSLAHAKGGSQPYFLSIKGPELLNKFVGETERHIRSIFARARSLASHNVPVVVFFDEMEALFRTRGTGISSDIETMVVPQLLAEMDGVEALDNVIIIGASNREDMIDPAVLRPGRLDVRIRIDRPTREGATEIFSKYLTPQLPYAEQTLAKYGSGEQAAAKMTAAIIDQMYSQTENTALFQLALATGGNKTIYVSDIVSGAMIAAIVERAKKFAVKDTLAGHPGITDVHMRRAFGEEMAETMDLATTTTPQEWARTTGLRGDDIISVVALKDTEAAK
ncbi:MAG: proteasome ATPase [Actinomycetaceae bacterium]|nr:proteasome ATPase [Actinomycetaceae bacterium]